MSFSNNIDPKKTENIPFPYRLPNKLNHLMTVELSNSAAKSITENNLRYY